MTAGFVLGLGGSWGGVMDVLREIIPVYDKVNSYISLGRDATHRDTGIRGRINPGDVVLDAGSGFGNMSKTALSICDGNLKIIMYDPLLPMLKNTSRLFEKPPALSCGVFEHMPFRSGGFDAIMCGYSLRDAIGIMRSRLPIPSACEFCNTRMCDILPKKIISISMLMARDL